jgi:hypothetical protein
MLIDPNRLYFRVGHFIEAQVQGRFAITVLICALLCAGLLTLLVALGARAAGLL